VTSSWFLIPQLCVCVCVCVCVRYVMKLMAFQLHESIMYTQDNIGSYRPAVNRLIIKVHSSFTQFISCCPPRPVQHDRSTVRPHTQHKSLHIHFECASSGQDQWTRQERGGVKTDTFLGCTLCINVERHA